MEIKIEPVKYNEKLVLEHLLELYIYDFTDYLDLDVNEEGLFTYSHLNEYWGDPHRFPFFIKVDGKFAGFVLVMKVLMGKGAPYNYIAEFFVMKKYRRISVGKTAAFNIFDKFPGKWLITEVEKNLPAQKFWHHIISEYTKGNFKEGQDLPGKVYQIFNS